MNQDVCVAAVQMVSSMQVQVNCACAEQLVAKAVQAGAQMVVLPEFFPLIGMREDGALQHAEADGEGPLQDFLRQLAARHGIWLVGGTVPLRGESQGKVRNSLLVFNPQGERVLRYDKVHLFSLERGSERYDESAVMEPGRDVCSFHTPFGHVGVALCYDLRFPELFRKFSGVDMIVLPAAFTYGTGQAHWEVLLRARAIENQCYVIASAQGGRHESGRNTWGQSMIVDPWGEILAQQAQGEGVVVAKCTTLRLQQVRAMLPALSHRVF
ncbi:MAG: carbon-nitrogen hydrolase family protein [Rhodocyclaceae bacterium]|nr:carbon-nitrogen hydrolase family protein [Rhodocyclaceae bacterium]